MKEYPKKPKKGDVVICIDDDSEGEDLGMSGIVLPGRKDLKKGKEYVIDYLPFDYDRDVPKKNTHWTKEMFPKIKWGWHSVHLKGIGLSVFLHNFEPK